MGSPVIGRNGSYEQDKTLLLGEVLNVSDFSTQKELIDEYVSNLLSGWDYGFSDTVFNFMINSGVTSEGRVVLIDLGELTFNKEEVLNLVKAKHWEKRSSFNKLENINLKNYIQEQFNLKVTPINLEDRWNSKVGTKF